MTSKRSSRHHNLTLVIRAFLEENPAADFSATVAWLRSLGYTIAGDGGKRLRQKWEYCRDEMFGEQGYPGVPQDIKRAGRYGQSQPY